MPRPQNSPDARDVAALARLSVFGALRPDTIRFLAGCCEDVAVGAGQAFFEQGQSGDRVFVLRSGRVAVERRVGARPVVLAELGPGDCFGELALVAIRARTASVRALEDCTALALPHRAIYELSERDVGQFALLQMNLAREVGRRLDAAGQRLAEELGGEG